MRNKPLFGPGGNCEDFYANGYKSSLKIPEWLLKNGLTAYEYQCGKGVKISEDSAKILGTISYRIRKCLINHRRNLKLFKFFYNSPNSFLIWSNFSIYSLISVVYLLYTFFILLLIIFI